MIDARHLLVFHENLLSLNDVSLRCAAGELVGVLGANGAGKSTLLAMLSGLLLDVQRREEVKGGERLSLFGEIRLDGERIEHLPAHRRVRRGVVLCPERRRLFAESSVRENLRIGAVTVDRRRARRRFALVLDAFPALGDKLRRPAGLLSGGEQQMVAIGRALMAHPRVLLLDEPLLGLAPSVQRTILAVVDALRREPELAIVLAEQHVRPVLPLVDRALVLENGAVARTGTAAELGADTDVLAAYFGGP